MTLPTLTVKLPTPHLRLRFLYFLSILFLTPDSGPTTSFGPTTYSTPLIPELNAVNYLAFPPGPPPTLRSLLPPPSTLSFTNIPSLSFQMFFIIKFIYLACDNGDQKVTNRDLLFFHVGFWTCVLRGRCSRKQEDHRFRAEKYYLKKRKKESKQHAYRDNCSNTHTNTSAFG